MTDATVQVRAFRPGDGPPLAAAWTAAAPQTRSATALP